MSATIEQAREPGRTTPTARSSHLQWIGGEPYREITRDELLVAVEKMFDQTDWTWTKRLMARARLYEWVAITEWVARGTFVMHVVVSDRRWYHGRKKVITAECPLQAAGLRGSGGPWDEFDEATLEILGGSAPNLLRVID